MNSVELDIDKRLRSLNFNLNFNEIAGRVQIVCGKKYMRTACWSLRHAQIVWFDSTVVTREYRKS